MSDDELLAHLRAIVERAVRDAETALADAVRQADEAQAAVLRELYGDRGPAAAPDPTPPATPAET